MNQPHPQPDCLSFRPDFVRIHRQGPTSRPLHNLAFLVTIVHTVLTSQPFLAA